MSSLSSRPCITAKELMALAERINRSLLGPYRVHGRTLRIQASVGTYSPASGKLPLDVIRHADQAMYAIKRRL